MSRSGSPTSSFFLESGSGKNSPWVRVGGETPVNQPAYGAKTSAEVQTDLTSRNFWNFRWEYRDGPDDTRVLRIVDNNSHFASLSVNEEGLEFVGSFTQFKPPFYLHCKITLNKTLTSIYVNFNGEIRNEKTALSNINYQSTRDCFSELKQLCSLTSEETDSVAQVRAINLIHGLTKWCAELQSTQPMDLAGKLNDLSGVATAADIMPNQLENETTEVKP
ncbi:MAG: hypothetical protein A3E84_00580 [Gammaproteobacteria bacterium RIFCSPHIGHO2_12_FULL_42_13]|nr:MAG: hypothetical protein A3E84_00580 [Gammaproteobacteria bacterium RIFCSPHIGHO2_12_FULL_42_13]